VAAALAALFGTFNFHYKSCRVASGSNLGVAAIAEDSHVFWSMRLCQIHAVEGELMEAPALPSIEQELTVTVITSAGVIFNNFASGRCRESGESVFSLVFPDGVMDFLTQLLFEERRLRQLHVLCTILLSSSPESVLY
jgi:hypothetical protein